MRRTLPTTAAALLLSSALSALLPVRAAFAQGAPAGAPAAAPVVAKIGVLTDMSGPFASGSGPGSVLGAQMAVEDYKAAGGTVPASVVFADHQNKPDVGVTVTRRWVDQEGVTAIVDVPNSGVGLAVNTVMAEKDRVMLASGTATSDLTGPACKPTTVQWLLDTWALGHAMAQAVTKAGGKKWYFISFDYALGAALERDTGEAVRALGGSVVGEVKHPIGTTDFSSYLLQAQASGADVIALADTGVDLINVVKQASEFGVAQGHILAALFTQTNVIEGVGLKSAQGLLVSEPFYWDLNEKTRAFAARFAARMGGHEPTAEQAAAYSATLAYLHAVQDANTIAGGKVVAQMEKAPIDDPLFGETTVRRDGRAVHAMYVFRVKSPAQSHGPYDFYALVDTIAPKDAFRPLGEGHCPLVQ